ncbi:integrase core domain-containing protein [Corynebacterium kozikiae]|uniref:integrase core domain-containing protein n=1 Tax=Corynebacterium kozikiae TaxID=2968469 RepID=UPI00359C84AA
MAGDAWGDEQARLLVHQWSRRYNNFHPHSSLGYLIPRQYADQWKQEKHGQLFNQVDLMLRLPHTDKSFESRSSENFPNLIPLDSHERPGAERDAGWCHRGDRAAGYRTNR